MKKHKGRSKDTVRKPGGDACINLKKGERMKDITEKISHSKKRTKPKRKEVIKNDKDD